MGETREEASFMDIVQSLERGCGEERKLGRFWWWEGENGSISGHKLSLLCPLKEENEDGNYFYFWFTFWFFEFINSTVRLVQIGYRLQCTLHVKFKQIGLVVGKKKKKDLSSCLHQGFSTQFNQVLKEDKKEYFELQTTKILELQIKCCRLWVVK